MLLPCLQQISFFDLPIYFHIFICIFTCFAVVFVFVLVFAFAVRWRSRELHNLRVFQRGRPRCKSCSFFRDFSTTSQPVFVFSFVIAFVSVLCFYVCFSIVHLWNRKYSASSINLCLYLFFYADQDAKAALLAATSPVLASSTLLWNTYMSWLRSVWSRNPDKDLFCVATGSLCLMFANECSGILLSLNRSPEIEDH